MMICLVGSAVSLAPLFGSCLDTGNSTFFALFLFLFAGEERVLSVLFIINLFVKTCSTRSTGVF